MKQITEYQILFHGIEHSQYFQGCGTYGTPFDDVATGTGDTKSEALQDALESLAQNDWDTSELEKRKDLSNETGCAGACGHANTDEDTYQACEAHWHVSIRVK